MFKQMALGALVVVALAACSTSSNTNGSIRVVHASASTPAVDVYVGGTAASNKVLSKVVYKTASSYLSVPSGSTSIKVCVADSDPTVAANCPISVASFTVESGKSYTILAAGKLSGTPALGPIALTDDVTPSTTATNAKVRLVHAAATVPGTNQAVDVYVTAAGADLSTATATIPGFTFGKASSPYLDVPAGNYQVRITLPGTKTVAIDTGSIALAGGKVYTGIALDPDTGTAAFQAKLLTDN